MSHFLILERLSKTLSKVANFDALVAGGAHFVIRWVWRSNIARMCTDSTMLIFVCIHAQCPYLCVSVYNVHICVYPWEIKIHTYIRKNTTILTYICKKIHKGSKNLLFENSTALAVKKNLKVLKAPEKEPK